MRVAYDRDVLRLVKWDGSGAVDDTSLGESFGTIAQAGRVGSYNYGLRVYGAKIGGTSYLSLGLGDPFETYACAQGEEITLMSVRFAFRDGKSESDLSGGTIRTMTVNELQSLAQNSGVLLNTTENGGTSYEYLRQVGGQLLGGDTLNSPQVIYPNGIAPAPEPAAPPVAGGAPEQTDGSSSQQTETVPSQPADDGTATEPVAPDDPIAYTDVPPSAWFYDAVQYVTDRGLMLGTGNGAFSPGVPMTRAMLVTVLQRLTGGDAALGVPPRDTSRFDDVPDGTWYTTAVAWAADSGIVTGVGNNRFAPDANITRQDLAVLFSRYAKAADIALPATRAAPTFNDGGYVADYARDAVTLLYRAGIVNGKDGNVFDPHGSATRAEAAVMLHRFAGLPL
jgi:hypothetical protein